MKTILPVILLSLLISCKTVPIVDAAKQNSINLVHLEIEKKADLNEKGYGGETALLEAIRHKNIEMIKMLIKAGADLNASNNIGATPLHVAVAVNSPEIISLLIKAKADINARMEPNLERRSGFTPLLVAAEEDFTQAAIVLIQAKPELNFKGYSNWNMTALSYATRNKNVVLMKALVAAKADVNEGEPLAYAREGYTTKEIRDILINAGAK